MQTVLITGVSRGIGKALAGKFLEEGWSVVGTFLNTHPEFSHEKFFEVPLNLANPESVQSAIDEISKLGKSVDVLINNAGVLLDEDDTILVPEKLRGTLDVNLIGTAAFTERALALLSSDAHIVNVSSSAGSVALTLEKKSHHPNFYPAYKISKAGLNMYTATLAARLSPEGKTVSSVHPGWVRTDMGGEDAPLSPEEAALHIYQLAISRPETGGFWFKGERLPW